MINNAEQPFVKCHSGSPGREVLRSRASIIQPRLGFLWEAWLASRNAGRIIKAHEGKQHLGDSPKRNKTVLAAVRAAAYIHNSPFPRRAGRDTSGTSGGSASRAEQDGSLCSYSYSIKKALPIALVT